MSDKRPEPGKLLEFRYDKQWYTGRLLRAQESGLPGDVWEATTDILPGIQCVAYAVAKRWREMRQ